MVLIEVKGIITKVYGRDSFAYILHNGNAPVELTSTEFFQQGESVRALCRSEEKSGKTILIAEKIEKCNDIYFEIEEKLERSAKLSMSSSILNSKLSTPCFISNSNKYDIEKIARKLYAAQQLGRFIIVKFHGDADGIVGALILRKFLKANYFQQNSAIYSVENAIKDIEKTGQQFRPLLIMVDFGSGEDSSAALALAKAGGIELISIDHHPPNDVSTSHFTLSLNPWNSENVDGSEYPAGLLCAMLASMLGIESHGLEKIACAGDKSTVLPISDEDKNKALVLDFVATYSGFGNGIEFYSNVLSKSELFDSILAQANAKLEETDRILKKNIKCKSTQNIEIFLFNLDNIAEKNEFPNRGKITGRIFDLVNKENKEKSVAVIGYSKKTLILRFNNSLVSKGVRANEIIRQMRNNFSDFIENGGGHARAAALRIKEGFENVAIDEIIKMIT
ncbi:MAG: DHH family phosphoesterase [Candidatus Micrarchaeota archaeon]